MERELPICEGCGRYMDNESTGLDHVGTAADPMWQITKHHCVEDITVEDLDDLMNVIDRADSATRKAVERRLWKQYHPDLHPHDPTAPTAFARVREAFSAPARPSVAPKTEPYVSDDPEWEAWKAANGFDKVPAPAPTTPLDDLSDLIPSRDRPGERSDDVDTSLEAMIDAVVGDAGEAKRRFDRWVGRLRDERSH